MSTIPLEPSSPAGLAGSRWLSAGELLLGAFVVVGHNVFRIVPNEVVILVVLGLVSLRWRSGGWAALGLGRPASWQRVVLLALAAAALRIALGDYLVLPFAERFWPPAVEPAGASEIEGNLGYALLALPVVWGFAAFGEEIAYRGYMLTRAAEAGGRSPAAWWIGVVLIAVLFGYGHAYKGPVGILDSGFAGLLFGAAYLLSGRSLWAPILGHGFVDTAAVAWAYFGLEG